MQVKVRLLDGKGVCCGLRGEKDEKNLVACIFVGVHVGIDDDLNAVLPIHRERAALHGAMAIRGEIAIWCVVYQAQMAETDLIH